MRRPPRSALARSSAASDVYKRQVAADEVIDDDLIISGNLIEINGTITGDLIATGSPVSYTHLRAHETVLDLVCRLLLETQNLTDIDAPVWDDPAAY